MKKFKIVLAVILSVILAGCAGGDGGSDSSSNTPVESSAPQSTTDNENTGGRPQSTADPSSTAESTVTESVPATDESDPQTSDSSDGAAESGDPDATFLVGLAGDAILRSELSTIFTNDGSDGSPETFSEDNFSGVLCDGFVYLADPSGVCRTSFDDEDVFDSESARFTDVSENPKKDYVRVNVGDTFCGLTLTEASVNFAHGLDGTEYVLGDGSTKLGEELGYPEIYFMGGTAAFDGEVTMTGYLCIAAEDEYSLFKGDMIFVPSGCECTLPVMSYRFDPDVGTAHSPRINVRSGMYWENDYNYIYLGNVWDTDEDLSEIPDDGSFAKVSVTLSDIRISCGIGMMDSYSADIADIEIL